MQDQDYYEILQVHPKADSDTIQSAYERLSQRYDPAQLEDVAEELQDIAKRKREEIERAYAVLRDAERRASYDTSLETKASSVQPRTPVDSQDEWFEDELWDYRPLPPAKKKERPKDFDAQPSLSVEYVERQQRRMKSRRTPFWVTPSIVAAIVTFIIGMTSLIITEGGTPKQNHADMMQEQGMTLDGQGQGQQQGEAPSAEQLTSDFEGQIIQARQTAENFSDNPNAWISLGNILYDSVQIVYEHMPQSEAYTELLPRWIEASEAYSRALEFQPDNAVVRSDMAVSLCNYGVGIGDEQYVEEGLAQAQQAAQDGPEEARVLLNLGTCLVSTNPPHIQDALENWRKVLLIPGTQEGILQEVQRLIARYEREQQET